MQDVRPDSGQLERTDAPSTLADYYGILGIKPGYSDIHLLVRFLRSCKLAMSAGDQASLKEIRRGFEVLRYEDTRIAYYRMHRLLVKREPLRFPEVKRHEMLRDIRAKEAIALSVTDPVITPALDYRTLLFDVVARVALLDLARIFTWGSSGLLLLMALPFIIASGGFTWSTAGIGIFFIALAYFALKARTSDYVTYPKR